MKGFLRIRIIEKIITISKKRKLIGIIHVFSMARKRKQQKSELGHCRPNKEVKLKRLELGHFSCCKRSVRNEQKVYLAKK